MTKKQRRRVWGSVTEMRCGKKYVLRWMQNTPQGRRRKTKTVYGTYREACAELDRIQDSLNGRPRKTLGYMTPSEKFAELVATTA